MPFSRPALQASLMVPDGIVEFQLDSSSEAMKTAFALGLLSPRDATAVLQGAEVLGRSQLALRGEAGSGGGG